MAKKNLLMEQTYHDPLYFKEKKGQTKPILLLKTFQLWKTPSGGTRLVKKSGGKQFKTVPEMVRWIEANDIRELPVPEPTNPDKNWNDFVPPKFQRNPS